MRCDESAWSPFRYPSEPRLEIGLLDYVGVGLWTAGETANFIVHKHLAGLRARGGTGKGIPSCIGSDVVTSPNYFFEILAWLGVILISRDAVLVVWLFFGGLYMWSWSKDKEKALRELFPDKYKKKRYTMIPWLL